MHALEATSHRIAALHRAATFTFDARVRPLRLPNPTAEAVAAELKIELRKGPLSMAITWPMHAAADFAHFAQWVAAVLK